MTISNFSLALSLVALLASCFALWFAILVNRNIASELERLRSARRSLDSFGHDLAEDLNQMRRLPLRGF